MDYLLLLTGLLLGLPPWMFLFHITPFFTRLPTWKNPGFYIQTTGVFLLLINLYIQLNTH